MKVAIMLLMGSNHFFFYFIIFFFLQLELLVQFISNLILFSLIKKENEPHSKCFDCRP